MRGRYFAAHVPEEEDIGRRSLPLRDVIAVELIFPRAAKTIDGARLEWEGTAALTLLIESLIPNSTLTLPNPKIR